jgi:hypothetical protein
MSKHPRTRHRTRIRNAGAGTSRPDTPELEGGEPLPEELTGKASATSDNLAALFANNDAEHIADGFRGGSDDDPATDIPKSDRTRPDAEEDVTAA